MPEAYLYGVIHFYIVFDVLHRTPADHIESFQMSLTSHRRNDLRNVILSLEGISPEERSALLELLGTKRYGLVWEEKSEDAHEKLRHEIPVLVEDPTRCIAASEDGAPHHVLIEGDNLHALTALQYTHAGKVDVIYIDPPYNTGNKDFRYNDDYVDKEDAWRHSKWLSFMKKRLELAKDLLNDDGVIYISIDDNEFSQLKILCDAIFLERNWVASVMHQSRKSISGDLLFSRNHNQLLVYAKSFPSLFSTKNSFKIPTVIDEKKFKNPDNDPRGAYVVHPVDGPGGAAKGNPYYEFLGITGYYRYSKEKMQDYFDDGLIVCRGKTIGKKYFLSQAKAKTGVTPTTWWDDVGTTTDGTKCLQKILPELTADVKPKPLGLIDRTIRLNSRKDVLILDFFAGSGTTLHATMALNAEDGGKRQCILVTNNENEICEEVTYERNKRVIQGYTTPKGETVPGLTANHLHYFKTEFVPREPSLRNRRKLMNLSVDLLRLKEDAWDRIDALSIKNELEAYQGKDFVLFVVLDTDAIPTAIEHIKARSGKARVYVFSPGAYAWDEEFEEVREQIDLCALPEAIYRALEPHLPAVKHIDDEVAA